MPARRCSNCSLNWPDFQIYATCRRCSGNTDRMAKEEAMSEKEARRVEAEIKFERYLESETPGERIKRESNDKERRKQGLRPLKEQLAHEESLVSRVSDFNRQLRDLELRLKA